MAKLNINLVPTQMIATELIDNNTGQIAGVKANPRVLRDDKFRKLKKSIQDNPKMMALRELMVFEHEGRFVTIGGNQRLEALRSLKIAEAPCKVIPADTTPEQLNAYIVLDNAPFGEWDWDMLANQWDAADLSDWGVDFPQDWAGTQATDEREASEDDFDETKDEVPTICKDGDIWQLGSHRLMCGDSTDPGSVALLMNGEKADMCFTDPPYGMKLDTDYSSMEGFSHGGKYEAGHVDDFKPDMVDAVLRLNAKETFMWGADYYADLLPDRNSGSWIVWDKRANEGGTIAEDKSSDKMFGSCFELCWSKNRHKRDIARVKWAGLFGMNQTTDDKRWHPTQKPVALVQWFFDQYGKEGEIVADLFGGSGTTLIAAEQLGRRCFMMELDPHYCDVIIARWEKLTGQKAERLTNVGQPTDTPNG